MRDLLWLTLLLFVVAALLRSDFFFYLLYLIIGLQVVARFWVARTARAIRWRRDAPVAAFPNEPTTVALELTNDGLLPVPWVSVHESVPPQLAAHTTVREVFALGAGQQRTIHYTIAGTRRGYYRLGPLQVRTGDVLGLGERLLPGGEATGITIYPQVLPLETLGLPAALPYGTLATHERLFSDPARPAGVRPYQPADGARRVDWKSTARTGALQVRRYQPAIAFETLIALAFTRTEYDSRFTYDEMERAILAAAAVANNLHQRGQPVGLATNGHDAATGQPAAPVAIGGGRQHLIDVLALLGRLEPAPTGDIVAHTRDGDYGLGWGSTLIVVSGSLSPERVAALLPLQRRGLNIALILTDAAPADLALARRHRMAAYRVRRNGSVG